MFGLSRSPTILWLAIVGGGFAVLSACLAMASSDLARMPSVALFAVAAAIAESFRVELPTSRPGNRVVFSIGAAAMVAAILVFPLHWAVVVAAVGMAGGNRSVWFKRLYNVGQYVLIAASAGLVWQLLRGQSLGDASAVPGRIAAVLTFF